MAEEINRADDGARRHVLIVGAGPTGLTLANDLARRGVPFHIVDAKPGVTTDSKGLALNVSSLYAYRLLGLGDQLGRRANRIRRLGIFWETKRYSCINFDYLPHDIDALVTQPQAWTETELMAALEAAGGRVGWSHTLLDIEERRDDVRVNVALPDGRVTTESYRYVVGCDGKHSAIRQALGADFAGSDYAMHFVLGDFHLDVDWPGHEVQYRVHADGFFIFVPIGENIWRVVVKCDGEPPARKPAGRDITDVVDRYLGPGIVVGEPVWLSRAPFYHRVADRLSSRRLFIAGDAAHLFSPIGGTGMNTGIQDVVNLGWKLALHYHGQAPERILQSYETERLPLIRKAAASADLSTRLIGGDDRDHPLIGDLAPVMANRGKLRRLFPVTHSGMGARVELPDVRDDADGGAGMLDAVFLELVVPHLLSGGGTSWRNAFHCIVTLPGEADPAATRDDLAQLRGQLARTRNVRAVYLGGAQAHTQFTGPLAPGEQVLVLEGDALRRIGAVPAVAFVRPDGVTMRRISLRHGVDVDGILAPYLHTTAGSAMEAVVS